MFKNNYQGGAAVEIFSGQGKDPVAKWKLSGGPSAIHKEYDKEVKGFVYCLEGSSQTVKMQIPVNGKMSLGLLQRFLVLQVNIPQVKDFSIELVITDSQHLKRRLHLSTVHKELSATLLHAKIPFVGLKRSIWYTLCIDLVSFSNELFKGFVTLDGITLYATCKVRRILTIKPEASGVSDEDETPSVAALMELIPRNCQFPPGVSHVAQVLNMQSLQKTDMRAGLLNSDCGTPGSLQPHPPKDKVLYKLETKKQRVYNVGGERTTTSDPPQDAATTEHILRRKTRDICTPPSRRQKSKQQPLAPAEKPQELKADNCICSPVEQRSEAAPTPAESVSCSIQPGLSGDLQVCSSWKSNEGSEPELSLQEVFSFLSQPHSPKPGQGQNNHERMETGDEQVQSSRRRRCEAQPEDDFIGSESDEDYIYRAFQHQRTSAESSLSTPRSPSPALDVHPPESHNKEQTTQKEISPPAASIQSEIKGRAEPTGIVPTRCLSPTTTPSSLEQKCHPQGSEVVSQVLVGSSSVSLSRRLLQEVKVEDFTEPKEKEDNSMKSEGPSDHHLPPLSCLRIHRDDDEELQMLASLKREQEEDECRASGLSASQIHHCNVSISMSSDDTSTWTHNSMPLNQGYHYQKEMSPLLQSNPREWMDVLSPPIIPPGQRRRSDNMRNNRGNLNAGEDESMNEEEKEEEFLNLLYDPCLNCYFDPKTGKYYELA